MKQAKTSAVQMNRIHKGKVILYLILFLFNQVCIAQSKKYLDSLLLAVGNAKEDSNAVNLHKQLLKIYYDQQNQEKIKYHSGRAIAISEKTSYPKGVATTFNLMAQCEVDLKKQVEYFLKAVDIFKSLRMDKEYCRTLMAIANAYSVSGNYDLAIDYQQRSLDFAQQINDRQMIAYSYDILANVYLEQNKPAKTIEYYHKSIGIKQGLKAVGDLEYSYYHIALAYIELKNYQKAIEFLELSIRESAKINYTDNEADSYISLGYIYFLQGKIELSLEKLNKGMELIARHHLQIQQPGANNILGELYFAQKEYKKAQSYFTEALRSSNVTNINKEKIKAVKGLRKLAELNGDFEMAYRLLGREKNLIDSSNLELSARKAIQIELQLQHNNEQNIKNAEIRYQKRILGFSFVAVMILLLMMVLVFYNYRMKCRANIEIGKQKDELEVQSKLLYDQNVKITSSISYARRIQQAVLPNETETSRFLDGSFVLYQPRDIVSGDFFFFKQVGRYTYIAAADCTGHGVPGAFMSMLGIALLNEIVLRKEFVSANMVLDELREQIKRVLQQKGLVGEQQDGMDIAFCAIEMDSLKMSFAGAHNPCCIFRQLDTRSGIRNENGSLEYIELSADHQPVGVFLKEKAFSEKNIQLQKGEVLYLYSDGYLSQFGGAKNEKFKTKRFKLMLHEICCLPLSEQKEILASRFKSWKGSLEQTDDVLVMGIRV